MVDPSAITDLEAAAANLDRLLRGWTEAIVAETQSTPSSLSKPESLSTINAGIQSLWRLVSIHKSIEQLKNPPAPADCTSLKTKPPSRDAQAPQNAQAPQAPVAPRPIASAASPAPTVPYVPSVPLVPSLGSLDEIIAKTDQVYAEVTALCEASGIPIPDPMPKNPHAAADQLGLNLLDALSRRAKYPGSGRLLDSIRNDLATSPP